jgi:4-hydroxy-tetrahydrodipicolinate synthase
MKLSGIWAAVVTPLDETLEPDSARAVHYYGDLLNGGCDGINLLGTTGEAMSLSFRQRETLMEGIAESGLPLQRFMCGTGAASLADAIALKKVADRLGFAAALVMPPFFYRDATDDGIIGFFDAMLSAANETPVVLYNFPAMSGITFSASLVERLITAFPASIVGIKDSSNSFDYERDMLARFPALRVFPGSEALIARGKSLGIAGCISGSVALWPKLARAVLDSDDAKLAAELEEKRRTVGTPLIPSVRARIARERNDKGWLRSVPPL